MNEVVLNKYSRLEDLWSATIHGIGIVLGVAILTHRALEGGGLRA